MNHYRYQRRVSSYAVFAGAQALEQRVRQLSAAGLMDAQIAATLEREGYQTPGLVHPITKPRHDLGNKYVQYSLQQNG